MGLEERKKGMKERLEERKEGRGEERGMLGRMRAGGLGARREGRMERMGGR